MAARVNNAKETRGRPFKPGNPGRPKGSRNKLSTRQLKDAREFFLPLLDDANAIIVNHFKNHRDGPDCATCRHYVGIVVEYVFGKPPQRLQVEVGEARREAERMADDLGLDGDARKEAVETAVKLLEAAQE